MIKDNNEVHTREEMPDREKVMHGLMACSCLAGVPNICGIMECPYRHPGGCMHQLARDALILLKEQETKELSESCDNCDEYDKEKHYCPKFCRVIRETIDEMKKQKEEEDDA